MEETDENFMQIINNDKYDFQQMIQEYNIIDENKKYVFTSKNYSILKKLFVIVFNLNKNIIEKHYANDGLTKKICGFLNEKVG